jgi:hypothetical protein
VSQLEAARREILMRAYMQKIAAALPKPSPEDVKKYYTDHPQLFSARRIYNVQEIVAPVTAGLADQLRGYVAAGKPIEEVANALKAKDIKFGGGSATRPAEQIPLELLAQIQTLKDGQSVVLETPQAITLLRITSSQTAPVDEATALPRIEQFLTNQAATEAVTANLKKLRADTKITYMGDFAKTVNAAPVAPAAAPAPDDKAKTAIEKGMAGLK